jgi:hypothetical protein
VYSVLVRRSNLLGAGGPLTLPTSGDLHDGRVLVYGPDENVADGASEYASGGFFNLYDAPPWDTWVAYSDRRLLSWVPPDLVGFAQKGIDVNAVDCMRWFR